MNIFYLYSMMALMSLISIPRVSALSNDIQSEECTHWVDSVYNTLSERQRVGQLIVGTVDPTGGSVSKSTIKNYVETVGVGGLLFSKGSLSQYAEMIDYAQSIAKVPLMITLDGEWGLAMRIPEVPRFPYNMTLGAISDPALLYEYGKEVARECRLLGVQVNFAPVLDVNSNPKNPVIGFRSFGEDPKRVALLGKSYSLGLEDNGVLSVSKHFPGHGDTDSDSHKTLPTVTRSRSSIDSIDFVPFVEYNKSKLGGVMVGHLSVPALDKSGKASSFSRKIVTDLLKDSIGFKGLVFTDALAMHGADVENGNNCVEALKAGVDILLNPRKPTTDLNALMEAINQGKISKEQVEKSVKKMLAYKYVLGLSTYKRPNRQSLSALINSQQSKDLITELFNASITVVRDNNGILPLGNLADNTIAIVNIGEGKSTTFSDLCKKYDNVDVYAGTDLDASTLKAIEKHTTVVAAIYNNSQTSQQEMAKLKGIPNVVAVMMLDPYKATKFAPSLADVAAIVMAYENVAGAQKAAAQAIFGGIDVNGHLPVNLNGIGRVGDGISYRKCRLGYSSPSAQGFKADLTARIDSAITQSIANGAFPGAQVIVGRNGDVVFDKSFGYTTKGGHKVDDFTLYDLASVSKAVATLPGIMKAYDLNLLDLDEPVAHRVPGMNVEGKNDLTPRQLLFHESGIVPALNLYDIMLDPATYTGKPTRSRRDASHTVKIYNNLYGNPNAKLRKDILSSQKSELYPIEIAKGLYGKEEIFDTIMQRIYDSPLKSDRRMRYSCLNFCILMDLEERITGYPHEKWVKDSIWGPIGAYNLTYRPTEKYSITKIAATENDTYLRKQHLQGYVHDELSAFSGGIQGNAGAFGTATDLAKLCQTWLNGGKYGDAQIFGKETNTLFTTTKSPNSRRGLGFDKPDIDNVDKSPLGPEANESVFGHTGYTGTAFWIDPENDFFLVFLCNRIDPSRNNPAFTNSQVRSTLMRIIYESLQ